MASKFVIALLTISLPAVLAIPGPGQAISGPNHIAGSRSVSESAAIPAIPKNPDHKRVRREAAVEDLWFTAYRIKRVKFTGGVAGATSFINQRWRPARAFLPNLPAGKSKGRSIANGWVSGPSGSNPPNLPLLIWYDFKSTSVRPAEVSFQPAQNGKYIQRAPTSYQFVGSNDATCNVYSAWTVLCQDLSDAPWRDALQIKRCKVDSFEIKGKFRCLGIRILATRGDGWANLRNIRMWKM